MLSKCANPECSTALQYLREGKVFKIESEADGPFVVGSPKPVRRVEHFWLCGPCAEKMTLVYDKAAAAICVAAKPVMAMRQAAS
jgi:hypothetical protein